MLREQRKILRELNKIRTQRLSYTEIDLYNRTKILDRDRLVKACKNLLDTGYLSDLKIAGNKTITHIELSYNGIRYKSIRRQAFIRATWDWITDHMVDIIALILSIISLVYSLQ